MGRAGIYYRDVQERYASCLHAYFRTPRTTLGVNQGIQNWLCSGFPNGTIGNFTIGRANGTIGITIGTNGFTNGTIGRTLNDIGIPLLPLVEP